MSENTNEQMDLGSGTATQDEVTDTNVSMAMATSDPPAMAVPEHTTEQEMTSNMKLTIKTPKEKKDLSIDMSASVQQVKHFPLIQVLQIAFLLSSSKSWSEKSSIHH